MRVVDAKPARGAELVREYGCVTCHKIPGVRAFGGSVGPPLGGLVQRAYIAGGVTNRPDTVARFIANPSWFTSDTAMPDMGVTLPEARDITAFLYSLPADPR